MTAHLLVTGAGGQVGRAFAALVPGAVLLGRAALDVTDEEAVAAAVARHRPDVVVHAAAWTRVDDAEADPEAARRLNAGGTRAVARATARAGARLVHLSTDYVFAGDASTPYREDDPTGPRSVYGATKLESEAEALAAPGALVVRTSWVFGEGHNFVRSILRAARSRDELTVVDDQVGLPTYAPDLAAGLLGLLRAGTEGIVHLAGGGPPASWAEVAEAALAAAGSAARVRRVTSEAYLQALGGPARPVAPRPAWSVLDCSRAAGLGVVLRPWREAVADYVRTDPA